MERAFAFFLLFSLALGRITYEGQTVMKCKFDASAMPTLEDSLDVWGVLADGTIDIRVKTPKERDLVESLLEKCVTIVPDLESLVQQNEAENALARQKVGAGWFDVYHTLTELNTWYREWMGNNSNWITSATVATSANSNTLTAYAISVTRNLTKPILWIEGGIHAREWIAPAVVNFIADSLINDYKAGVSQVVNILNGANVYILPVVNPDGYAYSWTNDRQWRKNRSPPPSGSTCYGTDLNRNFNSTWNQGGSSTNPCSDTYCGTGPASQREVQGIQDYFKSIQRNFPIYGAIDFHSYSQLVLRPWGYTSANSPNETYLKQLGDKYAADIRSVSGKVYTSQKSIDLYVTTGTASDYWYNTDITNGNVRGSVTYRVGSYTVELRPQSNQTTIGFQLPPAEIIPTGQENYLAVKNFFTSLLAAPVIKTN